MKPVTPNQAEVAGVDPEVLKAFWEKPTGAMKLKRDDNSKARQVFDVPVSGGNDG
jgi:hypothetical protein